MNTKNNSGFTIIEIITVMIVIGIITAFAVGRVADNKPELIAQKEVLKVHLRYAQSRSMNSNDSYGIESNGNTYWLFRISSANRVNFPGEQQDHIDLAAIGLSLDMDVVGNIACFNSKGIPYTDFDTDNAINLQAGGRTLTLSSGSDSESIIITPNTGFIQ